MILNSDHDFSRSRTRPSVTTCRRRAIDLEMTTIYKDLFFSFFHSKNKIKQSPTLYDDDFFRETKLQLGITIGREKKGGCNHDNNLLGITHHTSVYSATVDPAAVFIWTLVLWWYFISWKIFIFFFESEKRHDTLPPPRLVLFFSKIKRRGECFPLYIFVCIYTSPETRLKRDQLFNCRRKILWA